MSEICILHVFPAVELTDATNFGVDNRFCSVASAYE